MIGIYRWFLILACVQESFARRADIDAVVDELETDEEEDGRPPMRAALTSMTSKRGGGASESGQTNASQKPKGILSRMSTFKSSAKPSSSADASQNVAAGRTSLSRMPSLASFGRTPSKMSLVKTPSGIVAPDPRVYLEKHVVPRLREKAYTLQNFHDDMVRVFGANELQLFKDLIGTNVAGGTGFDPLEERQRTLGALYAVYCLLRLDASDSLGARQVFVWGSRAIDEKSGEVLLTAETVELPPAKDASKQFVEFFQKSDRKIEWAEFKKVMPSQAREEKMRLCFDTIDSNMDGRIQIDEWISHSKKLAFQRYMLERDSSGRIPWDTIEALVVESGIISGGSLNEEKTVAMLALTAIHDVMKMEAIWPTVGGTEFTRIDSRIDYLTGNTVAAAENYRGVKRGQKIEDHDQAIEYELTHLPRRKETAKVFHCFDKLSSFQKFMITFTQGCPNLGWLIQGEAPPGHLLTHAKQQLGQAAAELQTLKQGQKRSSKEEAAVTETLIKNLQGFTENKEGSNFYLVHWWTDVAGGMPFPDPETTKGYRPPLWPGAEKLMLQMPLHAVVNFVNSFDYVKRLTASTNEVALVSDYMRTRFRSGETSPAEIAVERLMMHAPGIQQDTRKVFPTLAIADKKMLADEMGYYTGTMFDYTGRKYPRREVAPPSFLLYYGPAFLSSADGQAQIMMAMQILAAIYAAARKLWPLEESYRDGVSDEASQVTITLRYVKEHYTKVIADARDKWVVAKEGRKPVDFKVAAHAPDLFPPLYIFKEIKDMGKWYVKRTTSVSGMVVQRRPDEVNADYMQLKLLA